MPTLAKDWRNREGRFTWHLTRGSYATRPLQSNKVAVTSGRHIWLHYKAKCAYSGQPCFTFVPCCGDGACKSCRRNVEQLRRAPLIAICLSVNEPDVPFHSTRQRKIRAWLFVVRSSAGPIGTMRVGLISVCVM